MPSALIRGVSLIGSYARKENNPLTPKEVFSGPSGWSASYAHMWIALPRKPSSRSTARILCGTLKLFSCVLYLVFGRDHGFNAAVAVSTAFAALCDFFLMFFRRDLSARGKTSSSCSPAVCLERGGYPGTILSGVAADFPAKHANGPCTRSLRKAGDFHPRLACTRVDKSFLDFRAFSRSGVVKRVVP